MLRFLNIECAPLLTCVYPELKALAAAPPVYGVRSPYLVLTVLENLILRSRRTCWWVKRMTLALGARSESLIVHVGGFG